MRPFRRMFDGFDGNHLLVRFGLLSGVVVVSLGLVLGQQLHAMVAKDDLNSISRSTGLAVNFATRAFMATAPQDSAGRLQAVKRLRQTVNELAGQGPAEGIRFVSPIYRFAAGSVPSYPQSAADRDRAMSGRRAARRVGAMYVITVPITLSHQTRPFATVAISLPAGKLDSTVASDTRDLYLILIGGLALLWLVLLPIAARAARLLRRQATDNERLARTDPLTGMPNRSWFNSHLETLAAKGPLGAMVVDVDLFKHVNDTYGHHVGDEVLKALAERLRAAVRATDVVARLGGDEFAVVLGTADPATLEAVAERIVSLAADPIDAAGTIVEVQVSVGVASATTEPRDVERLLREADDAMYRAKTAGGDRAELDLVHVA
jgi:diguanylate cyclase (GGDEF)-like protein